MEIVQLPTWANVIFAIALIMLGITSLSKKINVMTISDIISDISPKKVYYAFAIVVAVVLAAIIVVIMPPCFSTWYLIAVGLTIIFGAIISCCAGMDDGIHAILTTVIFVVVLIVFYTLLLCHIGYAAIWLATVCGFVAVDQLFFPNKKGK